MGDQGPPMTPPLLRYNPPLLRNTCYKDRLYMIIYYSLFRDYVAFRIRNILYKFIVLHSVGVSSRRREAL